MRTLFLFAGAVCLLECAGCGGEQIVRQSLEADHAARADAPTGQPPVPIDWLTIAPSDLPPTETPDVDPDPILPTMDAVYRTRRVPGADGKLLEWQKPDMPPAESRQEFRVGEEGGRHAD